jgi:hypothetical protein
MFNLSSYIKKVELSRVMTWHDGKYSCDVPSKVNLFGWRLLLNRLPTRAALNRRGILLNSHDLRCVFCLSHNEDNAHLFFYCPFSNGIWNVVFGWLGKAYQTVVEGWNHFKLFGNLVDRKNKLMETLCWNNFEEFK